MTGVLVAELERVRQRTLDLLDPFDDTQLRAQHSPLMSPLVWDLAHVGNFEDQWLVRALGGTGVGPHHDDLYDAFRHPRPDRPALPLLGPAEARRYLAEVRDGALERLAARTGDDDPLLIDAFVHRMVVQHEHQHDETMLATIALMGPAGAAGGIGGIATAPVETPPPAVRPRQVLVPAGSFSMGTDLDPWAYDNERPSRTVDVDAFWIDATPVSNQAYLEFVEAGGYDDPRWWSEAGWAWCRAEGAVSPLFWSGRGSDRTVERFGRPLDLAAVALQPVQHVSWYEADAYARWAGRRLPTEAEWEKAASWDPALGRKRRYPWGDDDPNDLRANLGQRRDGPADVGTKPAGASPYGAEQMVGDVWEWTSSDFTGHPGFRAFPYAEYSEVFFGDGHKVLRGGSWATDPVAVRCTFRNWDLPVRRQIFSGFRCAADA